MQKVKISEVCKISNGFAFKSEKYVSSDGARVIRITNVQKGKIVDNDPKLYPFSEVKNLENYKINEGDIMMSLTGNVGRVGKFPKELLPAYINQRVCRIKSNTEKLSDDFLFHFLNSDKFENDAVRNSAGAAQLNLSTNWLAEYEIPLPDLPTQQKIAAILDKADELRQYNQQLIAKYDALTQSLFLDMFDNKSFKKYKFNDIADNTIKGTFSNGPFGSDLLTSELVDYGVPVIYIRDIAKGTYLRKSTVFVTDKKAEYLKNCQIIGGDVLIAKVGTPPGSAAIYPKGYPMGVITQDVIRIRVNQSIIKPEFLQYWFNSHIGFKSLSTIMVEGTRMRFGLGDLKKTEIGLPPIELQNQFTERIQLIEAQKQQAQYALAKSEALFQGLLQQAFNGELS